MTRTTRRKLLNVVVIVLLFGSYKLLFDEGGWLDLPMPYPLVVLWTMVVLVNIPVFNLRQVFRARRLLNQNRNDEAAALSREFINEVETRPWKRFLCLCSLPVMTDRPELIGYMCLARALRQSGDLAGAQAICERAAQIDPLAPMPHIGMAGIAATLGDIELAAVHARRARELGFSGSWSDRVMLAGEKLNAELVMLVSGKK